MPAQREAANHLFLQQAFVDSVRIIFCLHHELIEARRAFKKNFALLRKLVARIRGLGQILPSKLLQSFAAVNREIDRGHGGDQRRSEERRVGKECRSRWSPY